MSSIVERAKVELKAMNFGDEDSAVMVDILERFFRRWDSGGAVHAVAPVLQRLIAGQPLTPLTGTDDEWLDVTETVGRPCWQNRRCSSVFREEDGEGKILTYDIDAPEGRKAISFPYSPARTGPASPLMVV